MNVLLITSDQHNKFVMGCAGDSAARTPNLDRLAEQGVLFDAGYTNNPICMPARATLATGQYGSTIGTVDNGSAYDGDPWSWGHLLRATGHQAITFGKLHFAAEADSGFDMRLPLQAKAGYGPALIGWARGDMPRTGTLRRNLNEARPGEFEYTTYDRYTADSAVRWLENDAPHDQSWAAHVSFAYPHYPFRVPESYLRNIDEAAIDLPPQWQVDDWPDHPAMNFRRHRQAFDDPPLDEAALRNVRWIYYGMVQFLDELVGRVLDALDASGMADDTLVIYTSDHGDMLGEKGLYMKGVMYEGSAGVPMIVRAPGVQAGTTCATPVSLVDVHPTVLTALGVEPDETAIGRSLCDIAAEPTDGSRVVFSEYHGPMSRAGNFMIRRGSHKYVECMAPDSPAQLFDLATDPRESTDLAASEPAVVDELAGELRKIVDPEALDASIRERQAKLLRGAGGIAVARQAFDGRSERLGGYTIPPDEIMEVVGWPDDPDWADR